MGKSPYFERTSLILSVMIRRKTNRTLGNFFLIRRKDSKRYGLPFLKDRAPVLINVSGRSGGRGCPAGLKSTKLIGRGWGRMTSGLNPRSTKDFATNELADST